jgi:DNA-binding response OmpR family regulator
VIDDDPSVRDYMQALVSRQGYKVFAAADGEFRQTGTRSNEYELR